MSEAPKEVRVLAIDPTTRGFAFAVMEGPQRLVDWGVKTVRPMSQLRCLAAVAAEIKFSRPSAIVLEDPRKRRSRRSPRVRRFIGAIRVVAAKAHVRTRLVSRREIQTAFGPSGSLTKYQICAAVAVRLPELAGRLPRPRKPWMSEDYRMNIFDAVALALTLFDLREKRRLAKSPDSS